MLEYLQSILDQRWKPISRVAIAAWVIFYVWFLIYAFNAHGGGLFIDMVNLVIHEGGHNLFGWFGPTLGLWGGTLLQLLVPFLLACSFFKQRQIPGFIFSLFFFFENWLNIATYMADARAMQLPLVTTGDSEFVKHDWNTIFGSLGLLEYDTKIAATVRLLGWCGMIGCVVWLALRARVENIEPIAVTFPKPAISLAQRYPGKPGGPESNERPVGGTPTGTAAGSAALRNGTAVSHSGTAALLKPDGVTEPNLQ